MYKIKMSIRIQEENKKKDNKLNEYSHYFVSECTTHKLLMQKQVNKK